MQTLVPVVRVHFASSPFESAILISTSLWSALLVLMLKEVTTPLVVL